MHALVIRPSEDGSDLVGVRLAILAQSSHVDTGAFQGRIDMSRISASGTPARYCCLMPSSVSQPRSFRRLSAEGRCQ
jgi:hypothetical protein